jgi:hypothetical protein
MISEIGLESGRITLQCFDFTGNAQESIDNGIKFDLEQESPGFHDCDFADNAARGYFSFVEHYEVENIVDGMTAMELKKRIKSAEFVQTGDFLFAWGNSSAIKLLTSYISSEFATATKIEFEFNDLFNLQSRFELCKSVKIKNPKESKVKTVSLTGTLDCYSEHDVIEPRNHEIKSVAGIMNTLDLGKITVAATDKGVIRIGTKKGCILPVDVVVWLIKLMISGGEQ